MVFLYFDFILHITCDIDESHRFLLGSAVRSGDAGHSDTGIRIRRKYTACSHLTRRLFADRAVFFQGCLTDAQDLFLCLIGIRHVSLVKDL